MTLLIWITLYIFNVFLNRFLNKKAFKKGAEIVPLVWFLPIMPTIVLFYLAFLEGLFNTENNWFTGKYW